MQKVGTLRPLTTKLMCQHKVQNVLTSGFAVSTAVTTNFQPFLFYFGYCVLMIKDYVYIVQICKFYSRVKLADV